MAFWRLWTAVLVILGLFAVVLACLISPMLVFPPLAAATLVLTAAALVVDYFGIARKRDGWGGFARDPRAAWARARLLERRFHRERQLGSPRTGWTARSLLLALVECDRLEDSREVVDFLSIDAIYTRIGSDITADALRAVALAELGRLGEARELVAALLTSRPRAPIVGYAAACVGEAAGELSPALEHVDRALATRRLARGARRDLLLLRARLLARSGRTQDAAMLLGDLAAQQHRREVEQLAERATHRGDAAVSLAAKQALRAAAPYR